jgi:hypothetical protein
MPHPKGNKNDLFIVVREFRVSEVKGYRRTGMAKWKNGFIYE